MTEYHVTIVGFDERVQVMSSLRKPCRIIIRGSDEKDHSFLVKGASCFYLSSNGFQYTFVIGCTIHSLLSFFKVIVNVSSKFHCGLSFTAVKPPAVVTFS